LSNAERDKPTGGESGATSGSNVVAPPSSSIGTCGGVLSGLCLPNHTVRLGAQQWITIVHALKLN